MSNSSVTTVSAYEILGVTPGATTEGIKKAYRASVRSCHPDLIQGDAEKAEATVRFRQVQEAYELLSDPAQRTEDDFASAFRSRFSDNLYDAYRNFASSFYSYERPKPLHIPEPETIIVDGVSAGVKYYQSPYGNRLLADLYVDFDDARRLTTVQPPTQAVTVDRIHLMTAGEEVCSSDILFDVESLYELLDRFESAKKTVRQQQEFKQQLDDLEQQRKDLMTAGRPVEKLAFLIRSASELLAKERLRRIQNHYRPTTISIDKIVSSIRAVEKELNRIKDGGSQLLVDGLIDGSIKHPDAETNKSIIDQIKVFTIRSGGQYGSEFDEAALYNFYAERVGDVVSVSDLAGLDLLIPVDDYIIDDPDLAPLTIQISSNKGELSYAVTYTYTELDGEKAAVGIVSVPYSAYKRNAWEYGKPSKLPSLPYGIRLWLQVRLANNVVVGGWNDAALQSRITKRSNGLNRGKKINHADQNKHESTMPPPWSNARLGRRR